jgi:hypothetical protein
VSTTRKVIYSVIAIWVVISAPALVASLLTDAVHILEQLGHAVETIGNSLSHNVGGGT